MSSDTVAVFSQASELELKPKEPAKQWAVEVTSGDTVYRANPKVYTKRDGLKKAQLEADILMRYNPDNVSSSLEMVHLNNFYPLLCYGISEAEGIELPLSEATFWDLPEQFVFDISEAIQEENPQYAVPFSALQQQMWANFQKGLETPQENTVPPDKSDKIAS